MKLPNNLIGSKHKFILLGGNIITGTIQRIDNKNGIVEVIDKFNANQLIPIDKIIRLEILEEDANDP